MNILCADYRIGGKLRYHLMKEGEKLMRVPDEVKNCVVFIGCLMNGDEKQNIGGTTFLLSYPYKRLINGRAKSHIYIVTAKHVLDDFDEKTSDGIVYLRFNFMDKPAQWIPIERNKWISHPDTDLAILPANQLDDEYQFDHILVPESMIVDDAILENEKIGIGDEIIVTGLFTHQPGKEHNIPMVRSGIIASMPNEPIRVKWLKKDIDAYLIEVYSVGGFSGSPVFVYLGGRPIAIPITKNKIRIYERLVHFPEQTYFSLGVISGHWTIKESETGFPNNTLTNEEKCNTGIAIVIPANKIKDMLNTSKLRKMREECETKDLDESSGLVPDSGLEQGITKEEFKETLKKVSRPKKSDEGKTGT